MSAGGINNSGINITIINGDTGTMLVDKTEISVTINKFKSAMINEHQINAILINGLANEIILKQTHILIVDNITIGVETTSPLPQMVFYLEPDNIDISVSFPKVFIKKGQGGNLFVTLSGDDASIHRFSFEGIKA